MYFDLRQPRFLPIYNEQYGVLLEKMIQIKPANRLESFEQIQKSIAMQTFEQISFQNKEKLVYQTFASNLCSLLCKIKDRLDVEKDVVKEFYDFFVKQTDSVKEIVLNNLYGRIGTIPVIDSMYDEELPFN